MDWKFFEKDIYSTSIKEIEFVRSPFYELSQISKTNFFGIQNHVDEACMKLDMIDSKYQEILTSPYPTRENTAFSRYAD